MSSETPSNTDVLIVGGGPAGLAAAIALRQRGLDCVVVEAQSPGIDKACGEGLMPDALASLADLGVHLSPTDGHPFYGIRFQDPSHRVSARFPHSAGIGIRRPHLHLRLADRAEATGATLLWNSRVQLSDTVRNKAMVNGKSLRFRWLIGADGGASTVRRWAGLDVIRRESLRFALRTHYRIQPWSDHVEVHWARAGQLYITPVAEDCVCVAFVSRNRQQISRRHRAAPSHVCVDFPEVAARLHGAEAVSQQRGGLSATRRLRRVASDSVALVGDASGSVDSITGEGLAIAFRQAEALAEAVAAGSLAPYRWAHAEIARKPRAMAALLLTLDRWPVLERRAMAALEAHPRFFQDMLSAHMGVQSLGGVVLRSGPALGWKLLTA